MLHSRLLHSRAVAVETYKGPARICLLPTAHRPQRIPKEQLPFTDTNPLIQIVPNMCTRRHVCYIYTKCGHAYALPEQIIECDRTNCVFSPNHPSSCSGASCKKTCWQYRQPTEQYSPQLPEFCPTCVQNGRR